MNRKLTCIQVTQSARTYFLKKGFSVHHEVGLFPWGRHRADLLAMNTKGKLIVIEVKSCWEDFRVDKKMVKYIDRCNQMYLAVPESLAPRVKEAVPDPRIGILAVNDYGRVRAVKSAKVRVLEGKVRKELIIRMAFRAGLNRRPKGALQYGSV